jgi:hypothetical protein
LPSVGRGIIASRRKWGRALSKEAEATNFPLDDSDIYRKINALADEEHELWEKEARDATVGNRPAS